MNLLFYAPQMAPYGGMEHHICELAGALAQRGHRIELVTTSHSLGRELREGLCRNGVMLRELALDRPRARRQSELVRKALWLAKQTFDLRRTHWDVIYTNGQSALARIVWAAGRRHTRIVHHHHTAADDDERAAWSLPFRRVIARAPEIVACSRATQAELSAHLRRSDIGFIPYLTSCRIDSASISERSYSSNTPLNFGFVGRLVPEKGIDAILALSRRPELSDVTWHIHGTGAGYDAGAFRHYPNVVYHGAFSSRSEMADRLLALDALVLFSLHNEGMPLSLIEAMAAGLPWIATDRGGTHEIALSPSNCLLVENGHDLNELAQGVRELAQRIRSGATSRREQRAIYDRTFSPRIVFESWSRFFEGSPGAAPAVLPHAAGEIR